MRLVLCLLFVLGLGRSAFAVQEPSATAAALRAIFNPQRAPAARSMGLFQANFLDALPPVNHALQLAVVVDTTESMSNELQAVRESLPAMFAGKAGLGIPDPDAGLAGTVQEQELVTALLRPDADRPSAITTLLAGPMLRGATVSQR